MKQSDPLQLRPQGTLPRPGTWGRSARLALAALCLYPLLNLALHWQHILQSPGDAIESFSVALVAMFWLFNYVVNIGFGVSWGRTPVVVLAITALAALGIGVLWYDTPLAAPTGSWLLVTMGYFYAHLGSSFLLSAMLATPGCEMRAIPHLFSMFFGSPGREHHCPAGFLHRLDQWESGR